MIAFSRRSILGAGAGALAATAISGASPAFAKQSITGWVNSTLAHMTLAQKVGQLMVQEVYGLDPHIADSRNQTKYGAARPVDVVTDLHLDLPAVDATLRVDHRGPGVHAVGGALEDARHRAGQRHDRADRDSVCRNADSAAAGRTTPAGTRRGGRATTAAATATTTGGDKQTRGHQRRGCPSS